VVIFWIFFIHKLTITEFGFTRNIFTNELNIDTVAGIKITAPWIQVSVVDKSPIRVCIDCDCRNINCRLISFNTKNWREFSLKEGFKYYWWANRLSFNSGNKEEYRGFKNILRGYAFDDIVPSFIKIEKTLD